MSTLKDKTIAETYDQIVKRADTYVQAGTNIEIMDESGTMEPTGLYLEGDGDKFVGIGITTPTSQLEIAATDASPTLSLTRVDGSITNGQAIGYIDFEMFDGSSDRDVAARILAEAGETHDGANFGADLSFYTADNTSSTLTRRMIILESGNVGIGITTPTSQLEIAATDASPTLTLTRMDDSITDGQAIGYIDFDMVDADGSTDRDVSARILVEAAETHDGTAFGADLSFYTADITSTSVLERRMIILDSGNVGIGTAAPAHLLTVNKTTTGYVSKFVCDADNAACHGITITAGADDASGTTYYLKCEDGDGGVVGYLQNASGTFTANDPSDIRLKEDVVDTVVKGLESVNAMKVRDFTFKKSGDKCSAGFIANELVDAFAPAVYGEPDAMESYEVSPAVETVEGKDAVLDDDGNIIEEAVEAVGAVDAVMGERILPMTISRDRLVPVLVKAIQELSAKVEALENA